MDSRIKNQISVDWYKANHVDSKLLQCKNESSKISPSTDSTNSLCHKNNTLTLLNVTENDISKYVCKVNLPASVLTSPNDDVLTLEHALTIDISNASTNLIYANAKIELALIVIMAILILVSIIIIFAIRFRKARFEVHVVPNNPVHDSHDEESSMLSSLSTTGFADDSSFSGVYKNRQ